MKKVLAAAALVLSAGQAQAQYTPVGPQHNVNIATITGGGWTQCYSSSFGTSIGAQATPILSACTQNNIMMAGRETGSDTFLLLAETTLADATFDTGANTGNFHISNGAEWYYHDNFSWGFAAIGDNLNKNQCDYQTSGADRFCLHTLNGVGGYRIGDLTGLNESQAYEKVFFEATDEALAGTVTPEPASLVLMATGLVGVAAIRRRRKA